jgi:predicted dehydrogenase
MVVRWRELGHAAEQVVAIASRTRSLAEKVAADFNIPVVYDSLAEMLADAELDAVINATPGPAHYATSMEILSAGKHLITDNHWRRQWPRQTRDLRLGRSERPPDRLCPVRHAES